MLLFYLYSTWCCALNMWHPTGPHCFPTGRGWRKHSLQTWIQKHHSWDSVMPGWARGYGRPDSTTHSNQLSNLLTLDKTSNDMWLLAHAKDAYSPEDALSGNLMEINAKDLWWKRSWYGIKRVGLQKALLDPPTGLKVILSQLVITK